MILKGLQDDRRLQQQKQRMMKHRLKFDQYKKIVNVIQPHEVKKLNNMINLKEITEEKQLIIEDLDRMDGGNDEEFEYFQQLAFFQQRYLDLIKLLKRNNEPVSSTKDLEIQFQQVKLGFSKDMRLSAGFYELDENKPKKNNKPTQQQSSFGSNQSSSDLFAKKTNKPVSYNFEGTGITKPIMQFFERKQKQQKTANFKNIITKPEIKSRSPISNSSINRSFKKTGPKKPTHNIQIQKLLDQNRRLYHMLQKRQKQENQLNQFEKNVLREERERCMKRIQELEDEVQQLQRNNYRLKYLQVQKSKNSPKNTQSMNWNDSYQQNINNYQPYALPVRHNDLGKISQKNCKKQTERDRQFLDMDLGIPPIEIKDSSKAQIYNTMNQKKHQDIINDSGDMILQDFLVNQPHRTKSSSKGYNYNGLSIDRGSNFDSFSIANTAYNNSSLFLNASKNLIAIDSETSTRNKVAFFKKSLVIAKDSDFQIAFKKSTLDLTKSKLRLIFYINNKTNIRQNVDISYDYQFTHYEITVSEHLYSIQPHSQGREVIEISLTNQCLDLNSVIDAHFKLGSHSYDLWVPACFVEFKAVEFQHVRKIKVENMVIQPDRQFRSHHMVSKLLPLSMQKILGNDETQAYLIGISKFGESDITLNWWQKQLTIETDPRLLDFLSFIMHHFK